ncbi:MAG: hypothetical protein R3B90_04325 [Planctomycetaceae bacterium]
MTASTVLLKQIEEIDSAPAAQRETAVWLIRFAADFLRQALRPEGARSDAVQDFQRQHPPTSDLATDRTTLAIDRCVNASGQLHQSMPVPMCLESLFSDISRVLRGDLLTV